MSRFLKCGKPSALFLLRKDSIIGKMKLYAYKIIMLKELFQFGIIVDC